jgi:hypothetical protein
MTAKHQLVITACALILSGGIANAGPCSNQTTGTGGGLQAVNRATQADQRQEHAQPSVAEQAPEPSPKQVLKGAIGKLRGLRKDGGPRLLRLVGNVSGQGRPNNVD